MRRKAPFVGLGLALVLALSVGSLALAGGGGLRPIDTELDAANGVSGLGGTYGSAVSPDGKHVYALGQDDEAVVIFRRNDAGRLSFVGKRMNGVGNVEFMGGPSAVGVSPDGRHVYVTADDDSAIVTFRRSRTSGKLTFVEALRDGVDGVDGLGGPCCQLAISRDGRNVYVPGGTDSAVSAFRRNEETGRLSFVGAKFDDQGGVKGLSDAIGVVASRDGRNVYVVGSSDSSLVSFERFGRKGKLRFINVKLDGVRGADGLEGLCCSLSISRNGRTLYVPAEGEAAIGVYGRSPKSGKVGFRRVYRQTSAGFSLMTDPLEVIPSRDGRRVWVASYENSVILALKRNRRGRLSVLGTRSDDAPGTEALDGAWRLVESPNGRNLYASAYGDDALVAFKRKR